MLDEYHSKRALKIFQYILPCSTPLDYHLIVTITSVRPGIAVYHTINKDK